MSIEVTQELAASYGAAWAKHDLDAILAMHADDTVCSFPSSSRRSTTRRGWPSRVENRAASSTRLPH